MFNNFDLFFIFFKDLGILSSVEIKRFVGKLFEAEGLHLCLIQCAACSDPGLKELSQHQYY